MSVALKFLSGMNGCIASGMACVLFMLSVNKLSFAQGSWLAKTPFGGTPRRWAIGFSIEQYGYIGTGRQSSSVQTQDIWEYDPVGNAWTQVANCGGGPRYGAVAFGIDTDGDGYNNYGFVATGMGNFGIYKNDLWQYDRNTNTWTAKASFPGAARYWAMGFSIGTKGYVGTGSGNFGSTYSDFYAYDFLTDSWTSINAFPGGPRYEGTAFSLDLDSNGVTERGYAGTGYYFGTSYNDIYEYNPGTGNWTAVTSVPGTRHRATSFGIVNKGYLGLGCCPGMQDVYEFDRVNNTWTAQAFYPGGNIYNAASFSIGCKGYVGTGFDGSTYLSSFFEFTPDACATILPVQLLGFWARQVRDHAIELSWTTASESNACFYTVQRSSDGMHFNDLNSRKASGFSIDVHQYTIRDEDPLQGLSYYRLKETDCDGVESFSRIVAIRVDDHLFQVYPNPATNRIALQYRFPENDSVMVVLSDLSGLPLATFILRSHDNIRKKYIDLKQYKQGMYWLNIHSANREYKPVKFAIIR